MDYGSVLYEQHWRDELIKKYREENQHLRAALEAVRWDDDGCCNYCGRSQRHEENCIVGQALKGWGE